LCSGKRKEEENSGSETKTSRGAFSNALSQGGERGYVVFCGEKGEKGDFFLEIDRSGEKPPNHKGERASSSGERKGKSA